MDRSSNLLDLALGFDQLVDPWPLSGKLVLIEDCVETGGSFVLHQLMKRVLSPNSSDALVFLALAHPFSHYDRILRKLGCNLGAQRANNRFFFFDLLMTMCPGKREDGRGGLAKLYGEIQKTICGLPDVKNSHVTVMIDDMSLMEVVANGESNHVLDFLHYCHTLTSEYNCSLVILNHDDVYSSMENPKLMLQMVYLADILIKAEPLATGLANYVHGQLTVLDMGISYQQGKSKKNLHNFLFKIRENGVEYFYPGSHG